MSDDDDDLTEAVAIVRDLARVDPADPAAYACRHCGTPDPVDKPMRHDDGCLYARAVRWVERRWERDEGWRVEALRRLEAVQAQLQQGRPTSARHVQRLLDELEAGIENASEG